MRVKKLELLGFKSFLNKTSISFEPGVTAIVGPNGSGKTNLVDAVRWALGEHNPRDVRAPRLEDVIFNGTDTKAPLSMAEVSLTFDNESGLLPISFSEVTVTRRVYRSGESDCFINQSPCRLKDIQELFLGTGLGGGTYAIIEQGHIDLILSSKPEERRVVFEEASGIAKYLAKKQETMRRLEEVEQSLLRLADITQEVRRQVSGLERQAAKARQYKTQWEQLKGLELRLAADELRQGQSCLEDLAQLVESLKHKRQAFDGERQRHLVSLEACQSGVDETQASLQDLRTRLVETTGRIAQHTDHLTLKGRWIEELTQQKTQLADEETQLEERLAHLGMQRERLKAQHAALEQEHKDLLAQRAKSSEELRQLEQRLSEGLAALEQGKSSLFEAAADASHQRNALTSITHRLQTVEVQLARAKTQRDTVHKRLEELHRRRQEVERERKDLTDQEEALQKEVARLSESASQANALHHELMGRLSRLREQLFSQRTRVQVLEELWHRYEGFPEAVKALLANPPEGVLGLLVDLFDPQPGYERAAEAALGPLASAIVVKDRQALKRCQERLAGLYLDGAHVVVLSDCPINFASPACHDESGAGRQNLSTQEGFLGMLTQFIRHDPAYACLMEWLLGKWQLVDEITRLVQVTPTLDGLWVSKAGDRWDGQSWQFAGSGQIQATRVGRKQRWQQAKEELEALEQDVTTVQQAFQQAEEQWQSLVTREGGLRQQAEQLTPGITKLEGQLAFVQHEAKRLQEELKAHELEIEECSSQQRELVEAQQKSRQMVTEAEARQLHLEEALKQTQTQAEGARVAQQQLLVAIAQLEAAIKSLAERQADVLARIEDLQAEQARLMTQREGKRTQAQGISGKASELTTQLDEHRKQIALLSEEQARLQAEVDQIAQSLREEEQKRDQVLPKLLAVEQELLSLTQTLQEKEHLLTELIFRRERILERLREIYQVDEAHVAEQTRLAALTEEERRTLSEQLNHLKKRLEAMGPVSVAAVEEYDELTKRHEFLQTQQQDCLSARDDLRHSIHQINRTARSQFRQTFEKIKQEFQHYFAQLFGGGQADVMLLDEEDVLESGIEIVARPPGKRLQSISLLSGGERALTAIALLFALFKVRPSPCCFLDEIDAPLDEANIDRFTRVLGEFLSLSQFILITHNKKTITKADSLYGVTMEQPGISKLVSVKLTKAKRPSQSLPAEAPAQVGAVV